MSDEEQARELLPKLRGILAQLETECTASVLPTLCSPVAPCSAAHRLSLCRCRPACFIPPSACFLRSLCEWHFRTAVALNAWSGRQARPASALLCRNLVTALSAHTQPHGAVHVSDYRLCKA